MATISNGENNKIGLALVGCGQIVTHHLKAIASLESSYVIRALCDPSSERRQVIQNLPSAASLYDNDAPPAKLDTLDDLLQDTQRLESIHVIFIAVPHDLHEALAVKALTATDNKIIVLEKPLAPTADACNRLVQISSQLTNSTLIVAEQSPHWQEVVLAKKKIADGAIGTIVSAAAYYYESMRDNVTSGSVDQGGGLGWRGSLKRAGGGITIDGGLHWIRPLREMLRGRVARVVGVTRRHLAPSLQLEGEVLGHALFEMASPDDDCEFLVQPEGSGPLIATYSCNMLATAPMAHDTCQYFRITGTQGELVIHGDGLLAQKPGAGGLRIYNEEYPDGKELFDNDRKGGFFLGFAGLWKEIHRICVQGDRSAAHETVVRAADDVRVVLALYRSSESGKWEET